MDIIIEIFLNFEPSFSFYLELLIQLLNNKFHGLSPSGGHHSLFFDQEFQKIASWDCLERLLMVFCIDPIVV